MPVLRFDQALGEREAEPYAAMELGVARLELMKLDEQALLLLGRDADASILDLDPQVVFAGWREAHLHPSTFVAELECVRKVVEQHLLEAHWIQERFAHTRITKRDDLHVARLGRRPEDVAHVVDELRGVHVLRPEIHATGFDFGQIEHIVDQAQ